MLCCWTRGRSVWLPIRAVQPEVRLRTVAPSTAQRKAFECSCRRSPITRSAANFCGPDKAKGARSLDALASLVEYLPLTTAAMRQAAYFGPKYAAME